MNSNCAFIKRGDHADCFHAGGGRGAKDDWCPSCLLLRIERAERAVGTMAWWLVQAQTGFGTHDARGIEDILRDVDLLVAAGAADSDPGSDS